MSKRTEMGPRAVAFHEAGHAVAAVHERVRLRSVSIEPNKYSAGRVSHHNPLHNQDVECDSAHLNRMRMERLVRMTLAGPAAQRRFNRRSWREWHGQNDFECALTLLSYFADGEVLSAYFKFLEVQVESFFDRPAVWDQVSAVAMALLEKKTMPAPQVRQLMGETFRKVLDEFQKQHAKKTTAR